MSNLVPLRELPEKRTTQGFLCLPRYDTRTSSDARYLAFLNKIQLQSLRYQVFPSKSLRGKAFEHQLCNLRQQGITLTSVQDIPPTVGSI